MQSFRSVPRGGNARILSVESLCTLKNGLLQGSVLAPTFFNVYISDLPPTESLKFGYADDWTLVKQSKTFSQLESTLSLDIGHLNEYFHYWKRRLTAKKTVATCFSRGQQTGCQKTERDTSGRSACTLLCTN